MLFYHILYWALFAISIGVVAFLLLHPLGSLLLWLKQGQRQAHNPAEITRPSARYGIIITAWKSSALVPPLVRSLLAQDYKDYHIFVIADQCIIDPDISSKDGVSVIYPATNLNSKTKAIDLALDQMGSGFKAAIIFDPDNLAAPNFLTEIDKLWRQGFNIIQGKRVAKNAQNQIAQLDGMGEAYYNFSTRLVPFLLGGSSSVSGSGMVLDINLYREILADEYFHTGQVIPAEDKYIQVKAILLGHKIAFGNEACVFDEKVSDGSQLERQRTRWLGSYFIYLPLGLKLLARGVLKGSLHWISFALWFMFPPVVLLFLAAMIMIGLTVIVGSFNLALGLTIALGGFIFNYKYSVKQMAPNIKMKYAIKKLPQFGIRMVKALFRIRETKHDFLATTNTQAVDIADLPNRPDSDHKP